MDCPACGEKDLGRDDVHNGVAMIYGPYGCPCGWSEWEEYDRRSNPDKRTENGCLLDQWGGAYPATKKTMRPTITGGEA